MKKNKNNKILLYGFAAVVIASLGYWYVEQQKPGSYDNFAKCLTEKGAKFYGAFWCPHCQAQKALFGKSKEFLTYIECSTADQKGQTEICKQKEIKSYPTWSFMMPGTNTASTTETFFSGEKTLEELAEKTSCVIDSNEAK